MENIGAFVMLVIGVTVLCMALWQGMDVATGAKTIHPNKENVFIAKVGYQDVWKTYSCVRVQTIKR